VSRGRLIGHFAAVYMNVSDRSACRAWVNDRSQRGTVARLRLDQIGAVVGPSHPPQRHVPAPWLIVKP